MQSTRSRIKPLDIFVLNFYNRRIFLQVARITGAKAYLVELATKKYKNGVMLTDTIKTTRNPFIVTGHNCYSKTEYYSLPIIGDDGRVMLPIRIEGFTFYAVPAGDVSGKYWDTSVDTMARPVIFS